MRPLPHDGAAVRAGGARAQGRALLAKVDTDASPLVAGRFGIRSIPTLVKLQGGRELDRVSGAMQAAQILSWVK